MKKLLISLVAIYFLVACDKANIPMYHDNKSYVQFAESYLHSVNISFFLYPTENTYKLPLALKLAGAPLQKNTEFAIVVLNESTAKAEHYDLPDRIEFQAGQATDTLVLNLNKVDGLDKEPVCLILEIQGKGKLMAGQTIYTRKIIWLSNAIAQPIWWDQAFVRSFLGVYTDKKFSEFIRITKTGDLDGMDPDRVRSLCLKFKAELVRLRNAGTPILEADGTDMLSTIPLLG